MRLPLVPVALLVVLFTPVSSACTPSSSWSGFCAESTCAIVPLEGPYYVAIYYGPHSGTIHTAVYEETNGIAGLQRQDDGFDDTCGGLIEPDTMLNARAF